MNLENIPIFAFGDSPEEADELLALVLEGKKTATAWPAIEGLKGAAVGEKWIVKDGKGVPRCVLETIELKTLAIGQIDETFAHEYGEGDQTLKWWNDHAKKYYENKAQELGASSTNELELYCERFKILEILS